MDDKEKIVARVRATITQLKNYRDMSRSNIDPSAGSLLGEQTSQKARVAGIESACNLAIKWLLRDIGDAP